MVEVLKEKLHAHLIINHPELAIELQHTQSMTRFLEEQVSAVMPKVLELISEQKPAYVIEELCLRILTESIGPSKFNYLKEVLETEFHQDYQRMVRDGVLTYEVINLLQECSEILDDYSFTQEIEEDRFLRYTIIAAISAYLN